MTDKEELARCKDQAEAKMEDFLETGYYLHASVQETDDGKEYSEVVFGVGGPTTWAEQNVDGLWTLNCSWGCTQYSRECYPYECRALERVSIPSINPYA